MKIKIHEQSIGLKVTEENKVTKKYTTVKTVEIKVLGTQGKQGQRGLMGLMGLQGQNGNIEDLDVDGFDPLVIINSIYGG